MTLTISIHLADLLPPASEMAQAGARGIAVKVKSHLRRRDGSAKHRPGFPPSGYWGHAAESVTSSLSGSTGTVEINKEGVNLHYEGGTVYPTGGRKALAIPVSPLVWDQRPAEFDASRTRLSLVWPKGSKTGTLRDKETGEVFYMLVSHATMKADPSVLPTDGELYDAAQTAITDYLEAIAS